LGATVDVTPDPLEKQSEGIDVAVYVQLPMGFDVAAIDAATVVLCLSGTCIPANLNPMEIGDHDGDGVADLMVTIDRQRVIALIEEVEAPADVTFLVSGDAAEAPFTGADTVQLVGPELDQAGSSVATPSGETAGAETPSTGDQGVGDSGTDSSGDSGGGSGPGGSGPGGNE
jgi:hypothetical protein